MDVENILENVWTALNFKTKNAFANSMWGERIDTINYAIKKNKIPKRLEMLIISKYPEVRQEYLRTGEGPVLRVDHNTSKCPLCKKKDEQINLLNEQIEHLLDEIEILKEYIKLLKEQKKPKNLKETG